MACESLVRDGDSEIVYGEGVGIHASTTIPTSVSLAIGDDIEGLRKQRKFAESKPRRFQEDDELYAEKSQTQQDLAESNGYCRDY